MIVPKAFWITGEKKCALRQDELSADNALIEVEMLYSGISRGTEALVFAGSVPKAEYERMRCPHQGGDFPFPVKYGYAAVGRILSGERKGELVFALHPHQDRFALPAGELHALPAGLPPERAVLAANMETALNIVWDSKAGPGDRIAVIGAGVVGALTAWLAARLPGAQTTLVDINPARQSLAGALGVVFAQPDRAPADCDVVIHASASAAGLRTALDCAGVQARVVEASWYGDRSVEIGLGGAFHSRRLQLVSSQVGSIPPDRTARWTYARRLSTALQLLADDDALDTLISGETPFDTLDRDYAAILGNPETLCHRIRYEPSTKGR
ncbi:dehydrogenase [Aliihoeflea aestuarii]|nr:dehydrogenase [Aliihoeflea aestuarii]